MPRVARELSSVAVRNLKEPGSYAVGGVPGLMIQVLPSGARTWLLRVHIGGRRREIGLGSCQTVSLKAARAKAREYHDQIREGHNPVLERDERKAALRAEAARQIITFDEAARQWLKVKRAELSNAKHAAQIGSQLSTYASPVLGRMPVADIELSHILQVLEPHWAAKSESMSRLCGRLREILDWAAVRGHRDPNAPNPAQWKGRLDKVLPAPGKIRQVKHHAALAYADVPSFMERLRAREAMAARCLEFTILCAVRSSEARGAIWDEIDLDNAVWTIPAARMKTKKAEHRVPLSPAAVALLRDLPRLKDVDLVFPSSQNKQMSDMALSALLKRMEVEATPHGFRSSFRDWSAECTGVANEVCEQALAHQIPSSVERAYRRGDLFAKRRHLMDSWAAFCGGRVPVSGEVVPMRAG